MNMFKNSTQNPAVPIACEIDTAADDEIAEIPGLVSPSGDLEWFSRDSEIARFFSCPEAEQATRAALRAHDDVYLRTDSGTIVCIASRARVQAAAALQQFGECIEAHNVMALTSGSLEEALGHYRRAVAAAGACGRTPRCFRASVAVLQAELCRESRRDGASAWERVPLRGYVRAVHGVANTLRKLGRPKEALPAAGRGAIQTPLSISHWWYTLQSVRAGV